MGHSGQIRIIATTPDEKRMLLAQNNESKVIDIVD